MPEPTPSPIEPVSKSFIEEIIDRDLQSGRFGSLVKTRFPPEPNGYLHIGHAKSICLNFGLAVKYAGTFNLRFDDTNPAKEDQEYVDSIIADVKWITSAFGHGSFDAGPHAGGVHYASDLFGRMYEHAVELVKKGKAYVCGLTGEEVSQRRGSVGVPATSPWRDRPIHESLRLLDEMRTGKHPDGSMTLRARIDLASPNFNLRDPVMYRIVHREHHNTGTDWCIYPMYDWAHGLEDSAEGITHSICTLEFEDHRPLYDWFIDAINEGRTGDGSGPWGKRIHHSRQIEFARLNLTSTVMSKRFLLKLVSEKRVGGWDDPRLPTISGLRRRGYTPRAIKNFCDQIGVTKVNSVIDVARLENCVRDDLNRTAPRVMAVLRPLRVVIDNWPAGSVEQMRFAVNPEDPSAGTRDVPFSGELYIERDDFMPTPDKGFYRLAVGQEVRLRWGYFITATRFETGADGEVTTVHCTYDPATRGGDAPTGPDGQPGRKVKGTLHWVSAPHALPARARLFDRLFLTEQPGAVSGDYLADLNPRSLELVTAMCEPVLADAQPGDRFQFERCGYFCVDPDSRPGALVFNRTVTLKDSLGKESGKGAKPGTTPGKTYSFGQTAHTLKITKERLGEVLAGLGMGPAPEKLSQDEFDRVRKALTPAKK